ncbi:uncharacterized protein LOC114520207 [Dendronephthya gigantea]|uniref:uncharacterized protein LOC114520207 n=1 Tax=Dendronephthya gigantea TaxID=151771 RepID=UPI00106CE201|nr:uncharacterized protein LOC114520207 [Dendronephthya gigantea]
MASTEEANVMAKNIFEKVVVDKKQDDIQKIVETVVQTWELVNKDPLKHGKVFYRSELGNLQELTPKLKVLGARHFLDYEVKPEHFKPVGECLLWTLKVGLGELFTTEVERAWTVIYTMLADVMIEGGKTVMDGGSISVN